ncbi:hypothetical protein AB5I41_27765 [Sphingomonas sp. MMS24-JH45]
MDDGRAHDAGGRYVRPCRGVGAAPDALTGRLAVDLAVTGKAPATARVTLIDGERTVLVRTAAVPPGNRRRITLSATVRRCGAGPPRRPTSTRWSPSRSTRTVG